MQDETPKRGKGRAFKWVLGLSLALNLLVIGAIAGAALRYGGDRGAGVKGPPGIHSYGAPFVRALPREARRAFHRELRSRGGLPSRADRRAVYDEMALLLRQDPFEPEAIRDLLARQQQVAQGVQQQAHEAWLALVTRMTPAERAAVAERLQDSLRKRRHRDKKRP